MMGDDNMLTREEFEDCIASTSNYKRHLVLLHDAAQRATIQQLTDELDQLRRTVAFSEKAYLKEHDSWGECKWKAQLSTSQATIQQLEAEIEGFRTTLGCHRAYILESIRDLHAKTEDIPNIDRVRQAEMKAQQLEAQVKELKEEVRCWRTNGVTEELLRRHDGYIKVGRGCKIVLDPPLEPAPDSCC